MNEDDIEVWKTTTVSPDYEVSTHGRVRSIDRVTPHGQHRKGKILSQTIAKSRGGYFVVNISVKGYQRPYYVHRLVAEAFLGPLPAGQHTRHGKLGKRNNYLVNLSYGTRIQNEEDKLRDGVRHNPGKRGTENPNAKLTAEEVVAIRRSHAYGARQVDLAADYGVTQALISQIIRRKTWTWL